MTAPIPNLAKIAYDDAKRFAKEGAFAKALERHEWFHEHALTYDAGFYGVRRSFALSSWVDLGKKYPPALESLKQLLDHNTAQLQAGEGDDEIFRDVVSINHVLGEDATTMALFKQLEIAQPEAANRRFRFMETEAFAADPELFLRCAPDLADYLQRHIEILRQIRENYETKVITQVTNNPTFLEAIQTNIQKLAADCTAIAEKLSEMAKTTHQPELAARILAMAEAFVQEPRVKLPAT